MSMRIKNRYELLHKENKLKAYLFIIKSGFLGGITIALPLALIAYFYYGSLLHPLIVILLVTIFTILLIALDVWIYPKSD